MCKYVWIAIGIGLLGLTIFAPYWPFVLFYGTFLWLACPHYNFLSSSCGEITAAFVLLRLAQVGFLVALAYVLWQLARRVRAAYEAAKG